MKCKWNANANAKMVNENGETLNRNDKNDKNVTNENANGETLN